MAQVSRYLHVPSIGGSATAHQGPMAQRADALEALHAHGLVEDVTLQDEAAQPGNKASKWI